MSLNYVKDSAYCTAIGVSQNANGIYTYTATINSGSSSVFVSRPSLTSSNVVIITPTSQVSGASLFWVVQTAGTGFTIYANGNVGSNVSIRCVIF
jgi:hypothetical protein